MLDRLPAIAARLRSRRAQGLPVTEDEADLAHLLELVHELSRPDLLVLRRALSKGPAE